MDGNGLLECADITYKETPSRTATGRENWVEQSNEFHISKILHKALRGGGRRDGGGQEQF